MDTILKFLRELERNNNKPWFDSHKNGYLEARAHFNALVEGLLERITSFDSTIKGVGVNDCTYRIYKDMRFSKDGLPYKTHFGAFIARGGRKSGYSGYYFHIGTGSGEDYPCRSFLAVGNYYTEPKVLKILREDIQLGGGDFRHILSTVDPRLVIDETDALKRVPAPFPADSPDAPYFKLKYYCLGYAPDNRFVTSKDLTKNLLDIFQSSKPFLDYINRAVEYAHEEQLSFQNSF